MKFTLTNIALFLTFVIAIQAGSIQNTAAWKKHQEAVKKGNPEEIKKAEAELKRTRDMMIGGGKDIKDEK